MSEIEKLHDELERQSELITALRNEIATKNARITELEADIESVAAEAAHTISGLAKRIAERDKRIAELESHLAAVLATVDAATAPDGRTYAEGCKP